MLLFPELKRNCSRLCLSCVTGGLRLLGFSIAHIHLQTENPGVAIGRASRTLGPLAAHPHPIVTSFCFNPKTVSESLPLGERGVPIK